MIKITLVCSAGMSTGFLVNKMKSEAEKQGISAKIQAISDADVEEKCQGADIILLGPQVKYLAKKVKEIVDSSVPVEVMNLADYGSMNGKNVLEQAMTVLNNHHLEK